MIVTLPTPRKKSSEFVRNSQTFRQTYRGGVNEGKQKLLSVIRRTTGQPVKGNIGCRTDDTEQLFTRQAGMKINGANCRDGVRVLGVVCVF